MRNRMVGLAIAVPLVACITIGDNAADAGADAGNCGTQNCTATQVCLYRECSQKELCQPSTSCAPGTTPADCSGVPGCLQPQAQCAPVLQGCRDIPTSCGGDVTCACGSICGSPAACAKVDGQNAECTGS